MDFDQVTVNGVNSNTFSIIVFHITNPMILSAINTAAHANSATVRRLFSLYATISATTSPTTPERIPPAVAVRSHCCKAGIWYII